MWVYLEFGVAPEVHGLFVPLKCGAPFGALVEGNLRLATLQRFLSAFHSAHKGWIER